MVKTKLHYKGTETNLWDFAKDADLVNSDYPAEKVIFEDKVRRGRLV